MTAARYQLPFGPRGHSNEILHKQTDPIVRLNLQMQTINDQQANRIGELHLVWEDTLGAEHKVSFATENDFLIASTAWITAQEEKELRVLKWQFSWLQQVDAGVCRNGPVVVFASCR